MLKMLKAAVRELAALTCPYRVGHVSKTGQTIAVHAATDYREACEWVRLSRPLGGRFVIQRLDFWGRVEAEKWGQFDDLRLAAH